MSISNGQEVLHIRKYPNRRFYDASRSRHITLNDIRDLIQSGRDVCVTDTHTHKDITNAVLFQIVLDKDQPKLELFPTSVLHWMIRANRPAMEESIERFFEPFMGMLSASRKQVEDFWRGSMANQVPNPMDWANAFMRAMHPSTGTDPQADDNTEQHEFDDESTSGLAEADSEAELDNAAFATGARQDPANQMEPEPPGQSAAEVEIGHLRRQVRDLTQRLDRLQKDNTQP